VPSANSPRRMMELFGMLELCFGVDELPEPKVKVTIYSWISKYECKHVFGVACYQFIVPSHITMEYVPVPELSVGYESEDFEPCTI
jgi:hypothetical protein